MNEVSDGMVIVVGAVLARAFNVWERPCPESVADQGPSVVLPVVVPDRELDVVVYTVVPEHWKCSD